MCPKREHVFAYFQTNTVKFLQQHVFPCQNADNSEEVVGLDDNANNKTSKQKKLVQVTDEEINAMIDVLDVNSFEIRGTNFSIRGVYPLTAMMNSVCNPNTQNSIDEHFVCRVR